MPQEMALRKRQLHKYVPSPLGGEGRGDECFVSLFYFFIKRNDGGLSPLPLNPSQPNTSSVSKTPKYGAL